MAQAQIVVTIHENGSLAVSTSCQMPHPIIVGYLEFAKNALMNQKPTKEEPNIMVAPADALNHLNNRLPHQG